MSKARLQPEGVNTTGMVLTFNQIKDEQQLQAGGKGGTLARLYQAGYPVPNGFVIQPSAFDGNDIKPEAWTQIKEHLKGMRKAKKGVGFAVRSSAILEDSARASFAGEFETVLNVQTEEEVKEAISTVRRSRLSERVKTYSQVKGLDTAQEIAVVVQHMVPADFSGVLFTADPVTGSRAIMRGNFVHGLGDRLVSGETDAQDFTFSSPKGRYEGPSELRPLAKRLYKMSRRLEEDLGAPQDIEWAASRNQLYLLQSRPITTLIGHDPTTGMWNDSLTGDYLWMNFGMGENLPGIMTPSTWSLWQIFLVDMLEWNPEDIPGVGNICGRQYMNISWMYSVIKKIYRKKSMQMLEPFFGKIPDVEIPVVPLSYVTLLTNMIPGELRWQMKVRRLTKEIPSFIERTPKRCRDLLRKIRESDDRCGLISLWREEVKPLFMEAGFMLKVINERYVGPWRKMAVDLAKLVGKADADLLLSTAGVVSERLASLGPMVGLSKIVKGEMSRDEYIEQFGHRCQYEWHLYKRRPYENPSWLEEQLEDFKQTPVDVEALLEKRRSEYEAAWRRFLEKNPGKANSMRKKIDRFANMSREREDIRSELTRVVGVVREWFIKAGEMTSLGEDVFFLRYQELLDILSGDESSTAYITARKQTHAQYESLPPYPAIINGRFDPFQWASDPNRRSDIFDSHAPPSAITDTDTITGNPGSGGRVEGPVRVINNLEEGDQLKHGEILVTATTNIGWTPLFPRAAAVVTDIGVPLAHAAIVARELGIPAVVGCGTATTRLKTGDRVLVDGGQGIVKILEPAS